MSENTTPSKVKAIASHLKKLSDEDLQVHIDDAVMEVDRYKIRSKHKERLQRYLAAHYASLNVRRPESHSIQDISVSYKAPREQTDGPQFGFTEYGQEYSRLLRELTTVRMKTL